MLQEGEARGKHLVIRFERNIFLRFRKNHAHIIIGCITVYTNNITGRRKPDAETRRLIRVIGCYNQRVSLDDIRYKYHYSSKNNVKIYLKILLFVIIGPIFL